MAWEVVDYNVIRPTVQEAAGGESPYLMVACPAVPLGFVWRVTGITVGASNQGQASPTILALVLDSDPQAYMHGGAGIPADVSQYGNLDVDDRNEPILVTGGNALSIVWLCTTGNFAVGSSAEARIQYELVQRTGTAARHPILGA